jgi:hypothetical protein
MTDGHKMTPEPESTPDKSKQQHRTLAEILEQKRAAALRDNLQRRKDQQRGRREDAPETGSA